MGISAVSYGTASFEPPPYGKDQLEQILLSYSLQVDDLSIRYKELGNAYHDLPLHVRNHIRFPKELRDLSMTAFTCSDCREIPDMIQIMNQLRESFARARAGIVCDEFFVAVNQLCIAAWLVKEAEDRVASLTWTMACYESFIKSLKDTVGAQAYCMLYRQASVGNVLTARVLMKSKWQDTLPKHLQGVESEKTVDSGYLSEDTLESD